MSTQWRRKVAPAKAPPPPPTLKVDEDENDFPMARIDFVRVGSAHVVCDPGHEELVAALLRKLAARLAERYGPAAAAEQVEIVEK
ncbi:MAG: hypothetical protein ACRC1K_13195 [Planctomycetia bacterium]